MFDLDYVTTEFESEIPLLSEIDTKQLILIIAY